VLGGRARVVEKDGQRVDNGQHILLGAYTETLRMLRLVGVKPSVLETRRLALVYPGEACELRAAPLPAPLHLAVGLLRARGLGLADKLAMARLMRHLKARRFRIEPDQPVAALLADTAQTERLSRLIWEPLCVAALNTPVGEASAQVFANVLRDSLAAGESASHLLIPRVDLSELFPVPASRWLAMRGHTVRSCEPIKAITRDGDALLLDGDPRSNRYDHVVVATAPYHVGGLVAPCRRWPRSSSDRRPAPRTHRHRLARLRRPAALPRTHDRPRRRLRPMGLRPRRPRRARRPRRRRHQRQRPPPADHPRSPRDRPPRRTPARRGPCPRSSGRSSSPKTRHLRLHPGLARPGNATPTPACGWPATTPLPYPATLESAIQSGTTAARSVLKACGLKEVGVLGIV
jgi:hypothetical protein